MPQGDKMQGAWSWFGRACEIWPCFDLGKAWWTRPGSNWRPPRCERGALPAELLAHALVRLATAYRGTCGCCNSDTRTNSATGCLRLYFSAARGANSWPGAPKT